MTSEKTYCYSYQRISSKQQRLGDGISRQLRESKKFCEQKDWIPDTSFNLTDISKSAYYGHNLDDTAQLGIFLNALDSNRNERNIRCYDPRPKLPLCKFQTQYITLKTEK